MENYGNYSITGAALHVAINNQLSTYKNRSSYSEAAIPLLAEPGKLGSDNYRLGRPHPLKSTTTNWRPPHACLTYSGNTLSAVVHFECA